MGFGDAIGACFGKYAVFRGRAPRSEYWWFVLFGFLCSLAGSVVDQIVASGSGRGPVSSLISLALFLPQLSVGIRRLHDVNRSGWWIGGFYLYAVAAGIVAVAMIVTYGSTRVLTNGEVATLVVLGAIAFIYLIWLFVLSVLKGTEGTNDYGPDPLGPDVSVF